MSENYLDSSRTEATRLAELLNHLDVVLGSELLADTQTTDVTALRRSVKKMLSSLRVDNESLEQLEQNDFYKTEPTLALQRRQLIKSIENTKIDLEFEVQPMLQKLARETVEKKKVNPPAATDPGKLSPAEAGEGWSGQKVLDTAEKLVDQAEKATGIIAKVYPAVKALALLVGIPLPF